MTSPQKRKGDAAELAVSRYLIERGVWNERIPAGATEDRGDLLIVGWCCEIKSYADQTEGIRRALEDIETAKGTTRKPGFCVIKRRGKSDAGEWLVTMTLADFCDSVLAPPSLDVA